MASSVRLRYSVTPLLRVCLSRSSAFLRYSSGSSVFRGPLVRLPRIPPVPPVPRLYIIAPMRRVLLTLAGMAAVATLALATLPPEKLLAQSTAAPPPRTSPSLATASAVLTQYCVSCHNAHPLSPKRDFKLNDVMGGIAITIPLDEK